MQDQKQSNHILTLTNPPPVIALEMGNLYSQVLFLYTKASSAPEDFPRDFVNFSPKTKIFVCFEGILLKRVEIPVFSYFLTVLNTLAIKSQCQRITLITSAEDLVKIKKRGITSLFSWVDRIENCVLFNPLFLTDRQLFSLFKDAFEACTDIGLFCNLLYLIYVSAQCSENFLPYFSTNFNFCSSLFCGELFRALEMLNNRKEQLLKLIAEKKVLGECRMPMSEAQMSSILTPILRAMGGFSMLSKMSLTDGLSGPSPLKSQSDDSDKESQSSGDEKSTEPSPKKRSRSDGGEGSLGSTKRSKVGR